MPWRNSLQFKFDYRPVITIYALFCIWQGLGWITDDHSRYTALTFVKLKQWASIIDLPVQAWGVPMVLAGILIFGGMLAKRWRVRWIGYAIASLTYLTVAESMRQSGQIFTEASQSGFRSYVFFGVFPIVLANVAQFYAQRRRSEGIEP